MVKTVFERVMTEVIVGLAVDTLVPLANQTCMEFKPESALQGFQFNFRMFDLHL